MAINPITLVGFVNAPRITLRGVLSPPRPRAVVSVDFEPPPRVGIKYGISVGQPPGALVFPINDIPGSVYVFGFAAGETFQVARIEDFLRLELGGARLAVRETAPSSATLRQLQERTGG